MPILNMIYWATWWGGWGWLPAEYQEVEYIQSSWTQYIDTGLDWENNYMVDAKILFTDLVDSSSDCCVLWSRWATRPNYMFIIAKVWYGGYNYWGVFVADSYFNRAGSVTTNVEYEVHSVVTTAWNNLTVDNSQLLNFSYGTSYSNSNNLWMFWSITGWTLSNPFIWRIYYMRIWDGSNNPLREFIPCYRIADSVIWMYDLVNDVFYTNGGTWTFSKWPDVN